VRASSRSTEDLAAIIAQADPDRRHDLEPIYLRLDRDPVVPALFNDCDVLFHLAGALRGASSTLFLHNVVATRRLLDAARRAELRRVVVVSSLAVYSSVDLRSGVEVTESCPLEPRPELRSMYAMSKIIQERVCWTNQQRGLPVVVMRPGVIYGPGRSPISDRVGLRIGRHLLVVGGRRHLPYTYVDNCARAVMLAGDVPRVEGLAINVVDDELPTGWMLARRAGDGMRTWPVPGPAIFPLARGYEVLQRHSQGQLPPVLGSRAVRALYTPARYSNDRAKRTLAWQPHVGIDEALRRTFTEADR
jgi:nucleoside-diphosphate-sugar epimerase